jgi:predicted MFS family arabinose efflux permease
MGLATAMGSLGQFVFAPLGQSFIGAFGPVTALVLIGGCVAFVPVLARALSGGDDAVAAPGSSSLAVREALTHPSFLLLASGFFVCGFHIAFVSTHLPPYLTELGLSTALAAWALGLIGLFNVVGAYTAGILGGIYSRRLLLSGIYASRAAAFALFVVLPPTPATVLFFAAAIGLLWLSTVPLTSGLIAVMFGTRHLGLLFGIVFLSHQVGAFAGAWMGGLVYDATGAYDAMWWASIALGFAAAIVHLPINERPVPRLAASPA